MAVGAYKILKGDVVVLAKVHPTSAPANSGLAGKGVCTYVQVRPPYHMPPACSVCRHINGSWQWDGLKTRISEVAGLCIPNGTR